MESSGNTADRQEKPLIIAAILLVATLVISMAFFFVLQGDEAQRVLFFPGNISNEISGEARFVTSYGNLERDIRVLVEEVILGPTSLYRSRVLPKDTRIQLFMLRDDVVYVDLSRAALQRDEAVRLDFGEAADVLERSVRFNFRSIEHVVITVDGQMPYEPYFATENRQNGA